MSGFNKFLQSGGGSSGLQDGTAPLNSSTITAANLQASLPCKTDVSRIIQSTKLDIADTLLLQDTLDAKLANPMTSNLDAGQFDIFDLKDIKIDTAGLGTDIATLEYNGTGNVTIDLDDLQGHVDSSSIPSIDNRITVFDGTSGELIRQSTSILESAGILTGLLGLTINGNLTANDGIIDFDTCLAFDVVTTSDSIAAIGLKAGGGTVSSIIIESTTGTADNSLTLSSIAGGIQIDAATETTINSALHVNHTAIANDDHAIEIDVDAAGFGNIKGLNIIYNTGAISAGEDEEAILINIDQSLSTGGRIVALEVIGTTSGGADIDAMECGVGCNPILHQSGTFGDATVVLVLAANETTALSSGGAGNISTFILDNDTITIQSAVKFSEIEFILDTFASGSGISPVFEFSDGDSPTTFASFPPTDGTNGMRNNGIVLFELVDIPGWVVGDSGNFEIRITRTRNSLSTVPIIDLVQISSTVLYSWNKDGVLSIQDITLKQNTDSNTWYGFEALDSYTPASALNNTAFGHQSLTAVSTGDQNTAVGSNALETISTTSDCTAVGYNALTLNTSAELTAVGSGALATNDAGLRMTAVGFNALSVATTGDDDCTAIGHSALALCTAIRNTAVGSGALAANTTGTNNVAIGYNALSLNTIGTNNIAIGNNTLDKDTNVSGCIAIGLNALTNCETSNNIAIGVNALDSLGVLGSDNIGIGINVMGALNTGDQSIGIGTSALASMQSGFGNTALGYFAASTINGSDSNCTAIGYLSLEKSTDGRNTAIGSNSLKSNTSGTRNTAIGISCLAQNTNGSDNTALGDSVLRTQVAGVNNNTGIGSLALELTTASELTAVGSGALAINVAGVHMTAIGFNALAVATTGDDNNTAIGHSALALCTSAGNTAVGFATLEKCASGFQNSAFGVNALSRLTIGIENTAVGDHSQLENIDGNACTSLGWGSLDDNRGGDFEVGIGYNALAGNDNSTGHNVAVGAFSYSSLQNGTANIGLGHRSGIDYTTTESDNICIGNVGVIGESGAIRIGNSTDQDFCQIPKELRIEESGGSNYVAWAAPVLASNLTFTMPATNSTAGVVEVLTNLTGVCDWAAPPLSNGYVFGFQQVNTSTTVMTFGTTAEDSSCRSSDNTFDLTYNGTKTITTSVTGILGISDTYDPVVANQAYDVYVIGDTGGTATTILAVESGTAISAAIEISGGSYNKTKRIGWFITQDAATTIIPHRMAGKGTNRQLYYTGGRVAQTVLSAGSATSFADMTDGGNGTDHYTADGSTHFIGRFSFGDTAAAGEEVVFRENGSSIAASDSEYTLSAGSALASSELLDGQLLISLGSDRITEYEVSNANNDAFAYVISFVFDL